MNILIAAPLYPPEIGGPATDAAGFATYLREHGHAVTIIPFAKVRMYPRVLRHLAYAFIMLRPARRTSAVVCFDTVSVALPAVLVSMLWRKPFIVRVPGDYAWEQSVQRFGVTDSLDEFQTKRYGLRVEFLRRMQAWIVQRAALVCAPSDYFAQVVAGWGVHPSKLKRIYLGSDPIKNVLPRSSVEFHTLFSLGRLVPWKGFRGLLDLIARLPEWKLTIAGDGPERDALHAHADALGVADRVTFTGVLSSAEVMKHYAHAAAFVFNTQWESFSFQVLEALTAGIPVITTRVGSLPELITDGVEGVLCAPDDLAALERAVLSVDAEPALWKERTEAGKTKAALFSLEASAEALTAAIISVCA